MSLRITGFTQFNSPAGVGGEDSKKPSSSCPGREHEEEAPLSESQPKKRRARLRRERELTECAVEECNTDVVKTPLKTDIKMEDDSEVEILRSRISSHWTSHLLRQVLTPFC